MPIQELLNKKNTITEIKVWLQLNADKMEQVAHENECRKWYKWLYNSETPFPCACPTRNKNCVFAEVYYELLCFLDILQIQNYLKEQLSVYNQIKHNKLAIFEWVSAIEKKVKKVILFTPKVKINIKSEPYTFFTIELDASETPIVVEFIEVFKKYYYSNEYNRYKN